LEVLRGDPDIWQEAMLWGTGYCQFRPRPDRPELFDQQQSFVEDQLPGVAILIGGNGSGTTTAAAAKLARFVLYRQPPPRPCTPFWVLSETYDQVCGVCWAEKLLGQQFLPECEIDWENISWLDRKRGWPKAVPLRPWPGRPGASWQLEFKSYEQGRRALQGRSIGGFWFSEQFPVTLLLEVLRGCREYMFPGSCFVEFTPVDPELSLWVESVMDDPPPGWKVYRLNTECNTSLAAEWLRSFKAALPAEMAATRLTGALPGWEGAIFETFSPARHVVPEEQIDFPAGVQYFRGIDWGASAQHPFAAVWAWRDNTARWCVFDEYWSPRGELTPLDHGEAMAQRDQRWELDQVTTFCDPSRPDLINLFGQQGWAVFPAAGAGGPRVLESIDAVRALLAAEDPPGRPRLVISSACRRLIEEMRKYRWKRPPRGSWNPQTPPPQPVKREDDCVDALRYMVHSAERQLSGSPPASAETGGIVRPDVPIAAGAAGREAQLARGFFRRR
jgi:phage terminase large subunit-like protein